MKNQNPHTTHQTLPNPPGSKKDARPSNPLNLPNSIDFYSENKQIDYIYTASGQKTEQKTIDDGRVEDRRQYAGSFVFKNRQLSYANSILGRFIYVDDGRGYTDFKNEYSLKDHLGNTRVTLDHSGNTVQQIDYYPFGHMIYASDTETPFAEDNRYLYNGKELQDDFDFNWYDYGARFYDAQIGRWHSVDPMAEDYYDMSPYSYCFNDPVRFIDPDGMDPYDEILKQLAKQEDIHIGYTVVHDNQTGETTITHTSVQEHPDKFSPIEKGEVNYQQKTTTYSVGSDGEVTSVSSTTSGLQVSVSAKGETTSDGYNIEGLTNTTESETYADAVHQPNQMKEFAQDPIVSGISAIKTSGFNGRDALTLQDWGLPNLSLTDKGQNYAAPATKLVGNLLGLIRGSYETPGIDYINWDRDRKTTLRIPYSRTTNAAARLNRLARKKYPTTF